MAGRHGSQTTSDGLHIVVRWSFANITARDSHSYVSADIGGVAQVGSAAPFAFYVLSNNTGPAWVTLGGAPLSVWSVVTETTASRSAANGEFVLVDAATCVVTLPAPAAGARVAAKVIAASPVGVEVRTSGAGILIDGTDYSSTGLALTAQWEQINIISDGTGWFIY